MNKEREKIIKEIIHISKQSEGRARAINGWIRQIFLENKDLNNNISQILQAVPNDYLVKILMSIKKEPISIRAGEKIDLRNYLIFFDRVRSELNSYHLPLLASEIFIYLAKHGPHSIEQLRKILKIPPVEDTRMVMLLHSLGLITGGKNHMFTSDKFSVIPIDKAIEILIKREKEILKEIEEGKENFLQLWNRIPDYSTKKVKTKKSKKLTFKDKQRVMKIQRRTRTKTSRV